MRSKEYLPKNNTVSSSMPSSGLTESSMVCGTRHQTGNFLQLGKRLRQKGCVDLPASIGRSSRAPESQEMSESISMILTRSHMNSHSM